MVTVRYFAAAEEFAGCREESRPETDLGALRTALATERPALARILPRCAVLVDGARVGDDTVLERGTVVDVLPPFAGG
jgi:molybdopterin converting factor small subunit